MTHEWVDTEAPCAGCIGGWHRAVKCVNDLCPCDGKAVPSGDHASVAGRGLSVRTMHPYGFHSGQWASLVAQDTREDGRPTWLVSFPDGATDVWVADDPQGEYEVESEHHKPDEKRGGCTCGFCAWSIEHVLAMSKAVPDV